MRRRIIRSKPTAVLALAAMGAATLVASTVTAATVVKAEPRAATKATKYSVTMKLPKKAAAKKRSIKVTFTPKKAKKVTLQKWKGGKSGKYVTIRTVKKPGGKSVTFTYTPAKGKTTKTKMRAVVTWAKKHRAATPGRTTTWTPASTKSSGATRAPGTGLNANGDPTANISEPASLNACWSYGAADARCRTAAVGAINLGRTREGLRHFTLPSNWTSLTPAQQMLVVSNDERKVRGLRQITRLSTALNTLAMTGAATNSDPLLSSWTVEGKQAYGWASNWAITPGGPLYSNFLWMYDDGIGSGNIDCSATSTSGCWGHRHNILAFGEADSSTSLILGAAETRTTWSGWSGLSDATLLVKIVP